jgi:hypothetical protein
VMLDGTNRLKTEEEVKEAKDQIPLPFRLTSRPVTMRVRSIVRHLPPGDVPRGRPLERPSS